MFNRLSSKLVAAFAFIIFLCLALAGSAFIFLLRDYQTRVALDRLADLSMPVSQEVRVLDRSGATPEEMLPQLKEQAGSLGARILVMDQDWQVVADTGDSLLGQHMQKSDSLFSLPFKPASYSIYTDGNGQRFYLVSSIMRDLPARIRPGDTPVAGYSAVLAVPEQSVTATWRELAPSLSISAAISLLVSIVVALVLSRSISGPLAQMTRASEAMAAGDYDQTLEVRGKDEIGRLASSFNTMAREVGRSHRTLRDFLADVSHELKTPLTSIGGFSQAMVDGTLQTPQDYVEAGRIINEEAERMGRLVDDLLYLSKFEAGQVSLERTQLDLDDLLRTCLRRWQRQAGDAQVQLVLADGDAVSAFGDVHRLEQVFDNLIFNAIKHTPPGGQITVEEQASPSAQNGHAVPVAPLVWVSVHNSGSSISAEDLPRVFERFYQAGGSAARNAGGTGLGLAIVKEIVEAHGGTVGVVSDPATGTKFTVTLPATLA